MPSPFLRWAGSKRKLLPQLAQYWGADHKRYVEPFMGSACLFFFLEPNSALLNDVNVELVNAFSAIRRYPKAVYNLVTQLPQTSEDYYFIRSLDPLQMKSIARAARFIYLNRFCFNGLYRTNKDGDFNVPYGPHKSGSIPSLEALRLCSNSLKGASLCTEDFESFVLRNVKKGDFVYLDPPYALSNKRVFRQYNAQTFGVEDIDRLDKLLEEVDRRGATFVLSYADCEEIAMVADKWTPSKVQIRRNIAGFADQRRLDTELIVTNAVSNQEMSAP